jgi:hypothetical protein
MVHLPGRGDSTHSRSFDSPPQAQRLVDRLLRETNSADAVVQALRADRSLSEKSLHAAWLVFQQRMTKQEK